MAKQQSNQDKPETPNRSETTIFFTFHIGRELESDGAPAMIKSNFHADVSADNRRDVIADGSRYYERLTSELCS
jgi:hypothetical protein